MRHPFTRLPNPELPDIVDDAGLPSELLSERMPMHGSCPFMSMPQEPNAVQIGVSLETVEPEVWRRLILPLTWNLEQLHLAIQAAFNWWNYHLHEFRIGGLRYGDPSLLEEGGFEDDPRVFDEHEVRLRDFHGLETFVYVYDFGDNWRHTVAIEKLLSLDAAPKQGTCVGDARARPPEDVGGVPGYEHFLAVMADPEDPEHAELQR